MKLIYRYLQLFSDIQNELQISNIKYRYLYLFEYISKRIADICKRIIDICNCSYLKMWIKCENLRLAI